MISFYFRTSEISLFPILLLCPIIHPAGCGQWDSHVKQACFVLKNIIAEKKAVTLLSNPDITSTCCSQEYMDAIDQKLELAIFFTLITQITSIILTFLI